MGFWSKLHLLTVIPTFVGFIIIALLLRKLLIKKSYKIKMLPIKIIAVIVILIEFGKQLCSILIGYDLYHLPFHFCSIFVYVLPLFAFYTGKGKNYVKSFSTATMSVLFIGMLVMPEVIYSYERIETFFTDYLSFHTVFFHNIVILTLFIIIALDLHKPTGCGREVAFIIIASSVFVAVAITASHLLDTNYSNFLHSTVSIVKTLYSSLSAKIGETPTMLIYTFALAVLHVLIILLFNYVNLAVCKIKEKFIKIDGKC